MAMEEDYCLLGVVTDEPDYKLCWMINQSLRMNFEKQDDLYPGTDKILLEEFLSEVESTKQLIHFQDHKEPDRQGILPGGAEKPRLPDSYTGRNQYPEDQQFHAFNRRIGAGKNVCSL